MIGSHLLLEPEFLGRVDVRLCPSPSEARPESALRRLAAALGRRFRRHAPPPLSDYMRRDVGLEPLPKRQEWMWPC
jgi:hypothetical protein